ncbi:MAG TPA: MerR family transcriptional regulator [Kofleriaceae bacterium]|jgi:DNA-binding transcriptional MerR regulator|nr:MerR family transcriptional regulator [Kofleriaceae bacterium]
MEPLWTLPELVAEVATRIAALPAPKNGQVRAVPDERTVRYYVTLGLLDRPSTMRGRTALYGRNHVAQVVAIKRLQAMGRSLSEIQTLWPTLDDQTLARMSGVELPAKGRPPARTEFWKREPTPSAAADTATTGGVEAAQAAAPGTGGAVAPALAPSAPAGVELRVELAPHVVLSLSIADDSVAISPADVRAIRAAAAPLLAELASRRLASHARGEEP